VIQFTPDTCADHFWK